MEDLLDKLRRKMEKTSFESAGDSDQDLRKRAAENRDLPAPLAAFADKIHRHAYKVTDEEVAALRAEYSDDLLFEVLVAAALGAGARRLDLALAALDAAQSPHTTMEEVGRASSQG